jgi:hypothetical protein
VIRLVVRGRRDRGVGFLFPRERPMTHREEAGGSSLPAPVHVEAVVVGAGPAGLMAARALRERGVDFVVLDKKGTLGLPLACGEGILLHELESLGLDFDPREYGTLSRRQVFLFSGITKRFSIDTFELDRPRFERRLAEPVLRGSCSARACGRARDARSSWTDRGTYSARVAILAKGPDPLAHARMTPAGTRWSSPGAGASRDAISPTSPGRSTSWRGSPR